MIDLVIKGLFTALGIFIEGVIYKFVIYDQMLPLVDEPFGFLLAFGIASAIIAGDVVLLSKILP